MASTSQDGLLLQVISINSWNTEKVARFVVMVSWNNYKDQNNIFQSQCLQIS